MAGPLRIVWLLSLLVAALALVACGGADERDAKNAYVRQVNAAQKEFATNAATVSRQKTPASLGQQRRTLQRFEAAIEDVAAKLRTIEVPGDVQAEHKQLVAAMTGFGANIRKASDVLRNPTTRSIAEARSAIATANQTANGRIDAAIAAINSKLSAT